MSTDNFGALGADFFIKTFDKGSLMSQSDLDSLVQYVQLTTTIIAIGDFTPDEQQNVWMILERVDVPSAPGYTVTNNTDVTMTSGGMVTINSMPWSKITGKPSLFSGDYNDLTNKPTLTTGPQGDTGATGTQGPAGNDGAPGMPGNDGAAGADGAPGQGVPVGGGTGQVLAKIDSTDYSTEWITPASGSGPTNEITNTSPEGSIYSVSVGTNGVVTMTTARGGIEFGAMPEVGGPTHFHIMRPASENGSGGTDLYFGDDYNYVLQRPAQYGSNPAYGVEIGANDNNGGAQQVWRFGTDGNLTTPSSLVIGSRPGGGSHIQQNDAALEIVGEGANSVVQIGWTANQSAPDSVALIAMNYPGGGEGSVLFAVGNNATTVNYWLFDNTGNLTLPAGGDIKDSTGASVLGGGFSGDYDDLTNKPTYKIAVPTGTGPGGNLQADSLALAGLNPTENIPSTYGGDLILQGGVGGANGDLYGEVRIKSGTIGANYEWHFTTDKKIKLPAGGNIVDSTGATAFVSLATLKQVVADSTDFADFQSRIANM